MLTAICRPLNSCLKHITFVRLIMTNCYWKLVTVVCVACCYQVMGFRLPSSTRYSSALVKRTHIHRLPNVGTLIKEQKFSAANDMLAKETIHELGLSDAPKPRNVFTRLFNALINSFRSFLQRVANVIKRRKTSLAEPKAMNGGGSSAFLTIPSIPIHKISNMNLGRQYAESKLQEIDAYFSRVQRKYSTPASTATDALLTNKQKRSITDLSVDELNGKRVFLRCDLDVPLQNGTVTDDARIRASLPTIEYLTSKGCKVILTSHLGRPKGTGYEPEFSLQPVAARLSTLLNKTVPLVPDCIGISVARAVSEMHPGDVVLLENVRFYAEEEANDADFAHSLAANADVYVNDAFSSAHRAHTSTAGITRSLRPAVSGLLLQKELDHLQGSVAAAKRPFAAIIGGLDVSSKVALLEALLSRVDKLVIGGTMAFAFLQIRGVAVGASRAADKQQLDLARRVEKLAAEKGVQLLLLPSDVVVADTLATNATHKVVNASEIPEGWAGVDIGPQTLAELRRTLADCKTVLWDGPLGVLEHQAFAHGTNTTAMAAVAATLAELAEQGCVTIISGATSAAAVEKAGVMAKMSPIFTGDSAALDLLEGKVLPGIAALDDKL